jgi:hypothetical protein
MAAIAFAAALLFAQTGAASAGDGAAPLVRIDYFFEPGCDQCERVEAECMPVLESRYAGLYELSRWDLREKDNQVRLLNLLRRLNANRNEPVFMVTDSGRVFAGAEEIVRGIPLELDRRIAEWSEAAPPPGPPAETKPDGFSAVLSFFGSFTAGGVFLAGLLDGINPCAISALVFMISVLAMAQVGGARLLRVGAAFCVASFLTYFLIGFGLLKGLRMLSVFPSLTAAFDILMIGLLVLLAALSFRDAFRYRRSGRARDITLQLPDGGKRSIHRFLRVGLGHHAHMAAAFAVGVAVTVFESLCTGQIYAPTLFLVARSGVEGARAWSYLLIYNVAFVVPLAVVLALCAGGLRFSRLTAWSARNVAISKNLMGVFFLALAVLLAAMTRHAMGPLVLAPLEFLRHLSAP